MHSDSKKRCSSFLVALLFAAGDVWRYTKQKMKKNEKLSEIMIEMAKELLKKPGETPSGEPFHIALLLTSVAWNREVVGDDFQNNKEYEALSQFEWVTVIYNLC